MQMAGYHGNPARDVPPLRWAVVDLRPPMPIHIQSVVPHPGLGS